MQQTMTAMRVAPGTGRLAAETVEVADPPAGHVLVRIIASGVCRADVGTSRRTDSTTPLTPGHEIAGEIAAIGDGVAGWIIGDRVAVGWFGGSCGRCEFCRAGDPVHCAERKTPGVSYPGGWAETVTVPADALAAIPDGLDFFDAAPLGCAGVTTFNAIRRAHLAPGSRVAVFGLGGLGHLAVQFAAKMGHEVVAIARGEDRRELAAGLGAAHYIDSASSEAGEALAALGGADLILSTASSTAEVSTLTRGLRIGGRLTLIGVDGGSIEVPAGELVMKSIIITGHITGSALDIEETMRFALANGVLPMIERMPLEAAPDAVERLDAGKPRFRIVLDCARSEPSAGADA